jgi:predicted enzyme related to lactoylglutathione lyase
MNGIVHFEIPVDDRKRAEAFYKNAFGWMINALPQFDYAMAATTESDENGMPKMPGAINGGMPKRGGPVETDCGHDTSR